GCHARGPGRSCVTTATRWGWATASRPMSCVTRAPPTCSTTALTSAWCRSCSATRPSPPRRCTPKSPPNGSGGGTSRPTRAPPARNLAGMATDAVLADLRAALENERDTLSQQLRDLGFGEGETGLEYDSNFADSSQV